MHRVAILAYNHLATFELACAIEIFALARPEYSSWYTTDVISFEAGPLLATGGITINTKQVNDLQSYQTLVIPGWDIHSKQVKLHLAEQVVQFAEQGKRIICFCSGAFLPALLGLLVNKQATTHWRYADIFRQRFPDTQFVNNVLYTMQDNIACSAGSAAALDLGLEIIHQDFGAKIANQVARRLLVSPHRQGGQAQYVETLVPSRQSPFAATLDWALGQLEQTMDVNDLAKRANMSRRSFDRHFRASLGLSPKVWLNQQRIHLAKSLLESDALSMEQLASRVGFDSAMTLRSNFQKYLGISPIQYKSQFFRNEQGVER
jgi:AraC family transcriptional activator FtrA